MEQAAALQFGDNEAGKILISPRHVGGGDDEAVAGAGGEPFLQPVGDVLRAANEAWMVVEGAAAGDGDEVARRRQAADFFTKVMDDAGVDRRPNSSPR
jgi:hypothetical protein